MICNTTGHIRKSLDALGGAFRSHFAVSLQTTADDTQTCVTSRERSEQEAQQGPASTEGAQCSPAAIVQTSEAMSANVSA